MTIIEAINLIDSLKPNAFSQSEKVRWLSQLDGMVKEEIINTHEGGADIPFNGYTEDDIDKELLIPYPHDSVYGRWLEAQIDLADNEYGRYNNSMSMFNAEYAAYERWYNRNYMPKSNKIKFF